MMRRQLLPALRIFLVFTVVCGLAYPIVMTGVALGLFNDKANGSLVEVDGQVVGSSLLGQSFTEDKYFQTRPSAAGALASGSLDDEDQPADPTDYSAANSGGSNLGPTNEDFLYGTVDDPETPDEDETADGVQQLVEAYREANGLAGDAAVPVDAVTSSASGLDPMISVANAEIQAVRVADVRGLSLDQVMQLVDEHTVSASLGFLGEKGVNVLTLNLALDQLSDGGS
jgi:K+-transporting ATPase ATPase C chain